MGVAQAAQLTLSCTLMPWEVGVSIKVAMLPVLKRFIGCSGLERWRHS